MAIIQFHGTSAEATDLASALTNNCECKNAMGVQVERCGAHTLVVDPLWGQRWLDHILFLRRIREAHSEVRS